MMSMTSYFPILVALLGVAIAQFGACGRKTIVNIEPADGPAVSRSLISTTRLCQRPEIRRRKPLRRPGLCCHCATKERRWQEPQHRGVPALSRGRGRAVREALTWPSFANANGSNEAYILGGYRRRSGTASLTRREAGESVGGL